MSWKVIAHLILSPLIVGTLAFFMGRITTPTPDWQPSQEQQTVMVANLTHAVDQENWPCYLQGTVQQPAGPPGCVTEYVDGPSTSLGCVQLKKPAGWIKCDYGLTYEDESKATYAITLDKKNEIVGFSLVDTTPAPAKG